MRDRETQRDSRVWARGSGSETYVTPRLFPKTLGTIHAACTATLHVYMELLALQPKKVMSKIGNHAFLVGLHMRCRLNGIIRMKRPLYLKSLQVAIRVFR